LTAAAVWRSCLADIDHDGYIGFVWVRRIVEMAGTGVRIPTRLPNFLVRKELRLIAFRGTQKKLGVTSESHEKALKASRAIYALTESVILLAFLNIM
jgi:hypothetical protein